MKVKDENQLIQDNLGLVKSIVNNFQPLTHDDFNEFVQLGCIGLLHAIRRHDPKKGQLSTIAWYYIYKELYLHLKWKLRYKEMLEGFRPDQNSNTSVWEILPSNLTTKEINIIHLKLQGYNFKEMSNILGRSSKWTSTFYKKILKKIKKANE